MRGLTSKTDEVRARCGETILIWNYPHAMPDLAEPVADPALAPSILVVEDEPGIVDFLKRGLQAEGFLVEAAFDGVEGAASGAE